MFSMNTFNACERVGPSYRPFPFYPQKPGVETIARSGRGNQCKKLRNKLTTDGRTDRQTDGRTTNKVIPMWYFALLSPKKKYGEDGSVDR